MNSNMSSFFKTILWVGIIGIFSLVLILALRTSSETATTDPITVEKLSGFPHTDTSKASIPLEQIYDGGVGRDGIPALTQPEFIAVDQADLQPETSGVLIDIEGIQKFYPYNILVWHEIINDTLANEKIAVTFCPLCGSVIVFDRTVNDTILEFGVSGYLFESNLLMYDTLSESLWSQSLGEAVLGDMLGEDLEYVPFQVLPFLDVQINYPSAQVLKQPTGYDRQYATNPYPGYERTDTVYFPVSFKDDQYGVKEVMYVFEKDDISYSIPTSQLSSGVYTLVADNGSSVLASVDDHTIIIRDSNDEVIPGYYEMWFSWITHHHDDGYLLKIKS
jgi:hypothetical protein